MLRVELLKLKRHILYISPSTLIKANVKFQVCIYMRCAAGSINVTILSSGYCLFTVGELVAQNCPRCNFLCVHGDLQ